ncbi:MAG: hypothetical protein WCI71_06840, partial [Bacteroidota bacterium]
MNHCDKVLLIKISLLIFVVIPLLESCHRGMPDPPLAKEIIHTDTLNGIAVTDPFHWMESAGDTALLSYIMAENSYTDEYMALLPGLMQSLCRELKERNGNSNVTDEKPANQNTCDSPDGKSRIYVNDAGQVRFHQTGSNGGNDPVIFSETRPGFKAGATFSASKKFLFIRSSRHNRSQTRFLPAGLQSLKPVLIQ